MRKNRKIRKMRVNLLPIHCVGFGLLGLAIAIVCYVMDAQCTMYGNKIKKVESQQAQY